MSKHSVGFVPMTWVATCTGWFACQPRVLDLHPGQDGPPPVNCAAGADWLPATPAPIPTTPPAHPADECGFYQAGFQYFLTATQPVANGDPAFATAPTPDDIFTRPVPFAPGTLAPPGTHRGTSSRAWLGDVKQPGGRQIAIDQDGHSIYYGTHVNQAFVDFVNANGLQTAGAIAGADPNLRFPPGVVALRSAWKDIDAADGVTGDFSTFITTTAWVSSLHRDPASGQILEDKNHPRQIRVALLALHVAFSLPDHPELIWTTFEHVDEARWSDVAPILASGANPPSDDPTNSRVTAAAYPVDTILYQAGVPANQANRPWSEDLLPLDETTQSLGAKTSIYRMFPASRSHTVNVKTEVRTLNDNVVRLFVDKAATLDSADHRRGYALVGGMWMDKPRYFSLDSALQNDALSPYVTGDHVSQSGLPAHAVGLSEFAAAIVVEGTDSEFSILGGNDRVVGTATESFTQPPGSFDNCFACHNTQAVTANGIPFPRDPLARAPILSAKLINVTHIFSNFVREQCGPNGVCP